MELGVVCCKIVNYKFFQRKLNQKRNLSSAKLIILNLMMQNNLEGYVKVLLKGAYIDKDNSPKKSREKE